MRDFWLARNEVTHRELAQFLEARGLRSPAGVANFDRDDPDARIHRNDGHFTADPASEEHPAAEVSRFGARDYCLRRGGRLPTEAGWEKAAPGIDRSRYPWSDEPSHSEPAVVERLQRPERGDLRPAGAGPTGMRDPRREPRRPRGRTTRDDPAPLLV